MFGVLYLEWALLSSSYVAWSLGGDIQRVELIRRSIWQEFEIIPKAYRRMDVWMALIPQRAVAFAGMKCSGP